MFRHILRKRFCFRAKISKTILFVYSVYCSWQEPQMFCKNRQQFVMSSNLGSTRHYYYYYWPSLPVPSVCSRGNIFSAFRQKLVSFVRICFIFFVLQKWLDDTLSSVYFLFIFFLKNKLYLPVRVPIFFVITPPGSVEFSLHHGLMRSPLHYPGYLSNFFAAAQ